MKGRILEILLVAFILNSCGEYQKVLKSDDYNYKYEKAVLYYENSDYNRAMHLFTELSNFLIPIAAGTERIKKIIPTIV